MTTGQFWRAVAVAQSLILLENLVATLIAWQAMRGGRRWLDGDRSVEAASSAWRALAELASASPP